MYPFTVLVPLYKSLGSLIIIGIPDPKVKTFIYWDTTHHESLSSPILEIIFGGGVKPGVHDPEDTDEHSC